MHDAYESSHIDGGTRVCVCVRACMSILHQCIHCLELHLDAAASNKQHSGETLHLFVRLPKPCFAISFVPQMLPQRGDLLPGACIFQYQQRKSWGKE